MSKIEDTRREMYRALAVLKPRVNSGMATVAALEDFESAMEAHLEVLRQKADKRTGRISQLKAWMRAAVRDNQRLRKDRKAFIETQEEHLAEIQRLSAYLDMQEGAPDFAGGEISSRPMPTYRETSSAIQAALQEVQP